MTMTESNSYVLRALESTQTEYGSTYYCDMHRCGKLHELKYGSRLVPKARAAADSDRPNALGVGQLVHSCLRYVNEATIEGRAERDWTQVLGHVQQNESAPVLDIREAYRLVKAYYEHYGHDSNAGWDPAFWELKHAEMELSGTLAYAVNVTGRADLVLIHKPTGRYVIADTKTRGQTFPKDRAKYILGLSTRPQFVSLSYMLAEKLRLDYYPDVIVDGVIKTKQPQFVRLTVPIGHIKVRMWASMMSGRGPAGPNTHSCVNDFGRLCEYYDWCYGTEEQRNHQYEVAKDE